MDFPAMNLARGRLLHTVESDFGVMAGEKNHRALQCGFDGYGIFDDSVQAENHGEKKLSRADATLEHGTRLVDLDPGVFFPDAKHRARLDLFRVQERSLQIRKVMAQGIF